MISNNDNTTGNEVPGTHGVHYLDNAAMSLKPRRVLDKMRSFSERTTNVHRGVYRREEETTQAFEDARKTTAKLLNAKPEEVIFTSGTTAALNMASRMLESTLKRGDKIATTIYEHHSNLIPWQQLAKRTKAQLFVASVKEASSGILERDAKITTITHTSNAIGQKLPVKKVFSNAKKDGSISILDAAQVVAHEPVDVKSIGCDMLAFSGHKLYAPTGTGALYVRKQLQEELPPGSFGGGMISSVTEQSASWNEPPWKFEAGTPNVEGVIGLAEAVEYVKSLGWSKIQKAERSLHKEAHDGLSQRNNVHILSPSSGNILSFTVDGMHPHDVAAHLDKYGVCVRAGHHCAMPLMTSLGITGTVRASVAHYNTHEDIEVFLRGMKSLKKLVRR